MRSLSFVQYKTFKLVYRRYAGLYFILCIDATDNEMLYLESIHLFVEVGDLLAYSVSSCRSRMKQNVWEGGK